MEIQALSGFTGCFSKAGLAIGSTPAQLAIAAPNGAGIDYGIDGKAYHKADTASTALPAATVQPVSTTCLYVICLNAAGTISVARGRPVLAKNPGVDETPKEAVQYPSIPVGVCPIGAIKISTNASTTFTMGTTSLAASGVADVYIDFIGGMPTKPELTAAT